MRNLILVLGDQLNADASAFDGFDVKVDAVWMAEVVQESEHVHSTKPRIAIFLAAMRHFRDALRARGVTVHYSELSDKGNTQTLVGELARCVKKVKPAQLIVTEPGEHRVWTEIEEAAEKLGLPLDIRKDRHFLCSMDEFRRHAAGRKQLRMEFFGEAREDARDESADGVAGEKYGAADAGGHRGHPGAGKGDSRQRRCAERRGRVVFLRCRRCGKRLICQRRPAWSAGVRSRGGRNGKRSGTR